jgi:tRNA nucleotidyltransferase/poly(A) polymerase
MTNEKESADEIREEPTADQGPAAATQSKAETAEVLSDAKEDQADIKEAKSEDQDDQAEPVAAPIENPDLESAPEEPSGTPLEAAGKTDGDADDDVEDDMDQKFDAYWDDEEDKKGPIGKPDGSDKEAGDRAGRPESGQDQRGSRPPAKAPIVLPEPVEDPEIPLELLDQDALWVVRRLRIKGYEAYLTGGCVRDLLLGRKPKDYDVATAAHPNQVKRVFRNCRLIGRRFRLAHILFPGGKVIETATFRTNPLEAMQDMPEDLLVERDNVYGTVEEDARRRDLTINGLFYDPIAGRVLDFVEGKKDLEEKIIRTIGDPNIRFAEDPVRMIRAVKFACRLGFEFEEGTLEAMKDVAGELLRCAPARLLEEMTRLLGSGHAHAAMAKCDEIGILKVLLPELEESFSMELGPLVTEAPIQAGDTSDRGPRVEDTGPPAPMKVGEQGDENSGEPSVQPASENAEPASETKAEEVESEKLETAEQPTGEEEPQGEADQTSDASSMTKESGNEGAEPAEEKIAAKPTPETVTIHPPSPEKRRERFFALMRALDDVREREVELTNALVFSTFLLSSWEAMVNSDAQEEEWLQSVGLKWTERFRFTRSDRETIRLLLNAQTALQPERRQLAKGRSLVGRPWFRDALLLYTLSLWANKSDLAEVGRWKVVAKHFARPYLQPKLGARAPRPRRPNRSRSGGRRYNSNRNRR